MDTSECITYAREQATIATNSTEWDSPKLLSLLNQARVDIFEPIIAACKCGYWTHVLTRTLGANNPVVRLPPRTAAFLQVDVRHNQGQWCPLTEMTEAEQQDYERISAGGRSSYPIAYVIRGSTMHLVPAAADGTYSIRVKVVARPSKLYMPQGGGIVTDVDTSTNTIELTSLPNDMITSAVISGTLNIDVIEPIDNFELSLFNAQATVIDSTHVQVADGYSLLKIQVGDYLRVANQSEWPQLPEPFHQALATTAAIIPCVQRDLYDRANDLRQQVSSSVIRLTDHLKPRAKTQTQERRPIQFSEEWR